MTEDPKYKRLTRARPRARFSVISTGNSSLWLGPDHVLCIDSNSFNESYKRFYFRDIQAFIVRKTDTYKYAALVLGVIGGLFALLGGVNGPGVGRSVWLAIASFFWLIMFINLAFGPTSVCYLQTAVQIEELPSLNRLRRARRVMGKLRPLINQAQGELTAGEISSRLQAMQPSPSAPAAEAPAQATEAPAGSPIVGAPQPQPNQAEEDPNAPPRISS